MAELRKSRVSLRAALILLAVVFVLCFVGTYVWASGAA